MPRSCWSTKAAGGRPSGTSRNGSIIRPARSSARSRRWRRRRRRSMPRPTSVRSRSPARSPIAISASGTAGARIIRGSSPGSTISPAAFRPSLRPSRAEPYRGRTKKPRTVGPGLHASVRPGSEPDVGAGAKHIGVERDVDGRRQRAIEAAVEVGEIDIELVGLHADIADDAELEAGADRPARRGDAAAREAGQGGIDVADREAAGEIRQEAVEGVAEA